MHPKYCIVLLQKKINKLQKKTIVDAGLNMSATTLAFTLAVIVAATAAPMSAVWLWGWEPIWKVPLAHYYTGSA